MVVKITLLFTALLSFYGIYSFPAGDDSEVMVIEEINDDEGPATEIQDAAVPSSSAKPATKKYYDLEKFKHINIDEILKNDRLLSNYHKCLLDKGPCTPEGSELKRVLPEAYKNDCEYCTEKQRVDIDKVLVFLIKNKPAQWKELVNKFDPKGEHADKLEKFKKEHNIVEEEKKE